MFTPKVIIDGKEYELSTKLRVAYEVQGQNGHKPYAEIFSQIDAMRLEQQIAILYAAFKIANSEEAKFITQQRFVDYYLDNYTLDDVMSQLRGVVNGILGKDEDIGENAPAAETEAIEGN